jgi:hypothetical protein
MQSPMQYQDFGIHKPSAVFRTEALVGGKVGQSSSVHKDNVDLLFMTPFLTVIIYVTFKHR